jgi:hypothetical protein
MPIDITGTAPLYLGAQSVEGQGELGEPKPLSRLEMEDG